MPLPADMTDAEIDAEYGTNLKLLGAHLKTYRALKDGGHTAAAATVLTIIEALTTRNTALVAEVVNRG